MSELFLFKKVHLVIREEFFSDNDLSSIQEARRRSYIILLFLQNTCPMLHFFHAKEHIKNCRIFEYYDVPPKYLTETVKFIESNEDLRKYIEITIKY
jgi:hypothetical protein